MVSHCSIEANPTKVDAIRRMNQPTGKKDVMKLTGMIVALGRFISKLGEKGLPFLKLLKKSNKFQWTKEADLALEQLKTFLTSPPVMVPPAPKETLLLYISTSTQVVSAMLVAEQPEEGHQYPI
jgi:dsDNA-binding SOS-regulon protein